MVSQCPADCMSEIKPGMLKSPMLLLWAEDNSIAPTGFRASADTVDGIFQDGSCARCAIWVPPGRPSTQRVPRLKEAILKALERRGVYKNQVEVIDRTKGKKKRRASVHFTDWLLALSVFPCCVTQAGDGMDVMNIQKCFKVFFVKISAICSCPAKTDPTNNNGCNASSLCCPSSCMCLAERVSKSCPSLHLRFRHTGHCLRP